SEAYAPVFAQGRAVPPAFAVHSALAATLQTRTTPLGLEEWTRRRAPVSLGAADHAALDSLGAAGVLPVTRSGALAAFVCLGHQRSGGAGADATRVYRTRGGVHHGRGARRRAPPSRARGSALE